MRSVPLLLAALFILKSGPCEQSESGHVQPREASLPQTATATEILVKFKPAIAEDSLTVLTNTLGLQKVREIRGLGVRVYRVPAGKTAQEVIKQLQADPKIEYAEPNYEYRIPEKQ